MRSGWLVVIFALVLACLGVVLWLRAPRRRLLHSAILAGIVVGRVAFGEAR